MKRNINPENVIKILSEDSSTKVFFRALRLLKIEKKNWGRHIAILAVCIIPTVIICRSVNSISLFLVSVENLLNVTLALFGIVFTGYAFFQALINKELLIRMLESVEKEGEDKRSKLQETNESFIDLMMIMILAIFIDLFLKITIGSISNNFILFDNCIYNDIVAGILILGYFFFSSTIIWEIKSFIFNIFQLFNAHAATRAIEIIDEEVQRDSK